MRNKTIEIHKLLSAFSCVLFDCILCLSLYLHFVVALTIRYSYGCHTKTFIHILILAMFVFR